MQTYNDLFSNWEDVQREFCTGEAEPEEVIYARYDYQDYSGDATVVYRNGKKFSIVEGGHCSCFGLETQFEPTDYTKDEILAALDRRATDNYYQKPWTEIAAHIRTTVQ